MAKGSKSNQRAATPGLRDLVPGEKVQVVDSAMQPLAVGTVRYLGTGTLTVEWTGDDRVGHYRRFHARSGREIAETGDRRNCIMANRSIRLLKGE